MKIKYNKQNYIIRPGLKVRVDVRNVFGAGQDKNWQPATVIDVLAQMFTCTYNDEVHGPTHVFREFSDVGRSWEPWTNDMEGGLLYVP